MYSALLVTIHPIQHFRLHWIAFATLFFAACQNKQAPTAVASNTSAETILQADQLLHNRLQAVLDADDTYAKFAAQPVPSDTLDAQSEVITQTEIALQKTIDSLDSAPIKNQSADQWQRLIEDFKKILQGRRALSDLRMMVSANNDDSTSMQNTLAQLHSQLDEKDKKIMTLQKAGSNQKQTYLPTEGGLAKERMTDSGLRNYAPAKSESVSDLKQRNKNLYQAYSDLQVKYFVLGRNYLLLKQEHDRTLKESAARQPTKKQ